MNIIFERPTLNRATDKENIALIDRWIADTVDKLNIDPEMENGGDVPTKLSELQDDSTHRTVTDAEKASWNNKASNNNAYLIGDTAATTIDDADYVPFSSTSGKRKITLTNIKAKLKTYFDTLYAAATHNHTKSQITDFAHSHTKSDITDFSHTHTKSDVTDFAHTHTKTDITDFPTLAAVATSGSYDDLTNEPTVQNAVEAGTTRSLVTTGEKYSWNEAAYYVENATQWYSGTAAAGATSVEIVINNYIPYQSGVVCALADDGTGKAVKWKTMDIIQSMYGYDYVEITFSALKYSTDFTVGIARFI